MSGIDGGHWPSCAKVLVHRLIIDVLIYVLMFILRIGLILQKWTDAVDQGGHMHEGLACRGHAAWARQAVGSAPDDAHV